MFHRCRQHVVLYCSFSWYCTVYSLENKSYHDVHWYTVNTPTHINLFWNHSLSTCFIFLIYVFFINILMKIYAVYQMIFCVKYDELNCPLTEKRTDLFNWTWHFGVKKTVQNAYYCPTLSNIVFIIDIFQSTWRFKNFLSFTWMDIQKIRLVYFTFLENLNN